MDTPRPNPAVSLRRVRWVQALVYAAIGTALVGSAVQSWLGVRRVTAELVAGQGRRLLHSLHRDLRLGKPPTRDALARVVRAYDDVGVRCLALADATRGAPVIAGDCARPVAEVQRLLAQGGPGAMLGDDGLAVMVAPRPRGRVGRGRRPPAPGMLPPGRGMGAPPPAHERAVLLVYEPVEATALQRAATRNLVVALVTFLALLVATILLWRLSRRAERLQATAARDRQLVSLGEMSAVLAHEIRNPLAALKGHAQLLVERLADGGPAREKAERVVTEARRLERLVEDLLSFVRSSQVTPAPVDPAALLRDAATAVDPDRIDVDAAGAPPTWALDAGRLRQLLVNLLRNALDASPDGARVDAAVGREDGALVFRVRDRGPGLPPGDPERLFEPFHTTRVQGTGLGLSVARRIAELHGGHVSARTHPDGGAEFRVVIP